MQKVKKDLNQRFKRYQSLFIICIVIILFFPVCFTSTSPLGIDFRSTGPIGDTIGGIMGPFIAIMAAFLTFKAFQVQSEANELYKVDIEIERLENRFYELIRLHKENVNEIDIAGRVKGRKAFMRMFYEFKYIYIVTEREWQRKNHNEDYPFKDLLNVSFTIFFNGIGSNSDKAIDKLLSKHSDLVESIKQDLVVTQTNIRKKLKKKKKVNQTIVSENNSLEHKFIYIPFDGHSSRLGHYYRHLFQAVKFIASYDEKILSHDKKISYLKTLRAQLSNHEQLFIYYNSFTVFGKMWYQNEYLTTYRMIHNLPIPLADFGVIPEKRFEKEIKEFQDRGEKLFEWDEW